MSGNNSGLPPVTPTQALWTWAFAGSGENVYPTVTTYSNGMNTKTGIQPADVANFIGVPLVFYPPGGGTPIPIQDSTILQWIRWAEDQVEQETGILLCQTWVAAPGANTRATTQATGLQPISGPYQKLGIDYDLAEASYDFDFARAEDSAWLYTQLRWKPVKGPGPNSFSGLKNYAFIYPLLNSYYRIDPSWFVLDQDFGLLRLVPNTNIQMLPLFALQLTFQGFAQSVPGGIWLQYVAGLTPSDYNAEYSFMINLVLATVAVRALAILQGSVNFGVTDMMTTVDGLQQKISFNKNGAYAGFIDAFDKQRLDLLKTAKNKVNGIILVPL